jgi:flagellar secretion chaperone FliS
MLETLPRPVPAPVPAPVGAPAPAPFGAPAAATHARAALAGYGRVSLEARVACSSPHQLVVMLYQRLGALLREATDAAWLGNSARRLRATERALAIVDGLDATLDLERGGGVAAALRQVYALLRDRLLAGDARGLAEAQESVEAIGGAWAQIAPAGR